MGKAADLLKRFLSRIGGIDKLADFDMEKLKEKEFEEFGCKSKRFEYDNTELVKAIFTVLWQNTFNLD
ncbi:MAG: hypothetical protein J5746_10140, partial [Victivallales bacterium]|nr:hypothetical protein [Victivallales bacterium]